MYAWHKLNQELQSIPLHPSGPEIVEIFLCLFGSAPERYSGVGPLKNIPSKGNDAWQAGKFALVRPYDSTVISLSSRFMASATQDEVHSSRFPLTLELKSNLKRSVRASGSGQRSGSLQLPLSPCSLARSDPSLLLARSHSVRSHDDRILAPSDATSVGERPSSAVT